MDSRDTVILRRKGRRGRPPARDVVLIVASCAFLMVTIIGLGLADLSCEMRQAREAVTAQLQAVAEFKIAEITFWRESAQRQANGLIQMPHVAQKLRRILAAAPTDDELTDVLEWLGEQIQGTRYVQALVLDANGIPVLWSPRQQSHDFSTEAVSAAQEAMRLRRATVCDIHVSQINQGSRTAVIVPLFAETEHVTGTGEVVGAVALVEDLDHYLFPLVRRWPIESASAESLLVRREGDNVVFLNNLRHMSNTMMMRRLASETNLCAAMAVQGVSGAFDGTDYRGVPVLAVLSPVTNTPWFMVVKVDKAEVLPRVAQRVWFTFLAIAALVLTTALTALVAWYRRSVTTLHARIAATERMQDAEQKYSEIFIHMISGFALHEIVCDAAGTPVDYRFLAVNPAFEQLTGLRANDIVGRSVLDVLPGTEHLWIERFGRVALTGEPVSFEEYTKPIDKWFEVHGYRPSEGRFAVVFQDITARKRADIVVRDMNTMLEQRVRERTAELEAANKELEAFAYSVSHDLRTPLRSISGFGAIMTEEHEAKFDAEGKRLLGIIIAEADRMGQLIDDLLEFSRMTRLTLNRSRIDMQPLVQAVFDEIAARFPGRAIQFTAQPMPEAYGDPAIVRQIWINLLDNAVKYTRDRNPAVIEVGSTTDSAMTSFYVKDNGVGFDMQYADRLFGVFQRLHASADFEGTGVGLALVQRIVHRHGGRAWADAKTGQGATFFFTLSMPPKE